MIIRRQDAIAILKRRANHKRAILSVPGLLLTTLLYILIAVVQMQTYERKEVNDAVERMLDLEWAGTDTRSCEADEGSRALRRCSFL